MNIVKKSLVAAVAVSSILISTTGVVSAYNQAEYTGNGQPQFNAYTSVENFGNEKDFFRVGPVAGKGSQFSNEYNVCEGEAQFNVYVHNGAPEVYNGTDNDGTGVAKDTKLAIKLQKDGKETSKAVISASNAQSVSDTAAVRCADSDVTVEYIMDSATVYGKGIPGGSQKLDNAVVSGGTLIGSYANNGIMAGCWDQRVYVTIKVKVTKKVVPPVTPPVTPPVQPPVTPATTLPKTGAGDMLGIVAIVTIAGAIAHNIYSRRTSRQ